MCVIIVFSGLAASLWLLLDRMGAALARTYPNG